MGEEVEDVRKKKVSAELEYRNSMPASSYQQQKLRVCEVCSAYLGIHDNDRRLADHFGGKLHRGFISIREKLQELKTRVEKNATERRLQREAEREVRRIEREKEEQERKEAQARREQERNRSRSKSRRRSRSRSRRSRSRDRKRRSRSRSRNRRRRSRSRSRDHRRRRSRSRSRDRTRRSRSRDRYRSRRSGSRSKRSHRSSSRERDRSEKGKTPEKLLPPAVTEHNNQHVPSADGDTNNTNENGSNITDEASAYLET